MSRIFQTFRNNAVKYSSGDLSIILDEHGKMVFQILLPGLMRCRFKGFFDRFYTVESARKSTGLGLAAISRTLAEQMGGSISAEYMDNRLNIVLKLPL